MSAGLALKVDDLGLSAKDGSPDLLLKIGSATLTFTPSVTGSVDLVEIFLDRFPRGRQIRSALKNGQVLKAHAKCTITLHGSGSMSYSVEHGAPITIGNEVDVPAELARVNQTLSGQCKFTGKIVAEATLELETWLFDASASAGAEISTGWHFGLRRRSGVNGGVEKLYHFEGLILRAYATAALSSKYEPADEDSFDDELPLDLPIKEDAKSNVEVTSNLGEPDITVNLIALVGRKDGWTAA